MLVTMSFTILSLGLVFKSGSARRIVWLLRKTWTTSCTPASTLDLWDILVVLVVMTRFDQWDALANM